MDAMHRNAKDRHAAARAALVDAVQTSQGETPPAMRASVFRGESADPAIDAYLELVRHASYRITPEVIQDLIVRGWSEDAIFEVTIVAAVGEAARRLDAGLQALQSASEDH